MGPLQFRLFLRRLPLAAGSTACGGQNAGRGAAAASSTPLAEGVACLRGRRLKREAWMGSKARRPWLLGSRPRLRLQAFAAQLQCHPLLSPVPRAPSCRSARGRPAADGSAVSGQGALQHDRQNASETAAAPGGGSGGGSSVIPASRSELIGISISRSLALLQDCRLLQAAEGQSLAARVLCRGSAKDGRFWWG